ncbi:MAG: hypothetical protein RML12_02885 [Xanthomonadales bacterium]|nr:hypothetical protein [Xanthomonadales bacterium]
MPCSTPSLRWRLGGRGELTVAGHNLGDRRHWPWASVRGLPANAPDLDFHAAPGRSPSLALAIRRRAAVAKKEGGGEHPRPRRWRRSAQRE